MDPTPAAITYALALASEPGCWTPLAGNPGLERRDLGLAAASGGAFSAHHYRATQPIGEADDWQMHTGEFEFWYVMSGVLGIETERETSAMKKGSVAYMPRRFAFRRRWVEARTEVLVIRSPGQLDYAAAPGPRAARPNTGYIWHDTPDGRIRGDGPRSFFEYRDLGTSAPTHGEVYIHTLRTLKEEPVGTGWHYHTMGQLFVVLAGAADVTYESAPTQRFTAGDAMCIPGGPSVGRHRVEQITAGFLSFQMCLPAQYETIRVAAPTLSSHAN